MQGKAFGLAALAAASIGLLYGPTFEAVHLAVFAVVLAVAANIDQETRRIPNVLVLIAFAVQLAYIAVMWVGGAGEAVELLVRSFVGAAAIGGGLFVFTIVVDSLRGGKNMGGGDVKLFAAVGLYLGLSMGLVVVALSCALGGCASLLMRGKPFRSATEPPGTFPLGPAIAATTIASMLIMSPVIQSLIMS
ncbi:MAG: prepilin peptidase [Eggerthellaceae bacterium]|nr:prepilin peptidase [Eggerthellaceae bacterium]